jgi:hypothetical protein
LSGEDCDSGLANVANAFADAFHRVRAHVGIVIQGPQILHKLVLPLFLSPPPPKYGGVKFAFAMLDDSKF